MAVTPAIWPFLSEESEDEEESEEEESEVDDTEENESEETVANDAEFDSDSEEESTEENLELIKAKGYDYLLYKNCYLMHLSKYQI